MVRPRYIAFELAGPVPLSRRDVGVALSAAAKTNWTGPPPQLTRYSWPHGIVRVEHDQLLAARKLLAGLHDHLHRTTLRTVSTSGTLRALTARTGRLAERGPSTSVPADGRQPTRQADR